MTEEHRNRLIEAGFVFIEQSNEYRVPIGRGLHMHIPESFIDDVIVIGEFDNMLIELSDASITER